MLLVDYIWLIPMNDVLKILLKKHRSNGDTNQHIEFMHIKNDELRQTTVSMTSMLVSNLISLDLANNKYLC